MVAKAHELECPECGSAMRLRESRHGLFYGCSRYPDCRGTHGAHPDGKPLGVPATGETKNARIVAHAAFDTLWKPASARLTRTEAYLWMQSKMGLRGDEAHIGRFTKEQCDRLVELVSKEAAHHG